MNRGGGDNEPGGLYSELFPGGGMVIPFRGCVCFGVGEFFRGTCRLMSSFSILNFCKV